MPKPSKPEAPESIGAPILITIGSERLLISYTVTKLNPEAAEVISIGERQRRPNREVRDSTTR